MADSGKTLIALDVGERRIGVARADAIVGFANPLTTLERSESTMLDIQQLLESNQATTLVIGLPRGLDGQETAQTSVIRQFADELKSHLTIPVVMQDEALTSQKAEAELNARKNPYKKSDIDALAATYILEDYMAGQRKESAR